MADYYIQGSVVLSLEPKEEEYVRALMDELRQYFYDDTPDSKGRQFWTRRELNNRWFDMEHWEDNPPDLDQVQIEECQLSMYDTEHFDVEFAIELIGHLHKLFGWKEPTLLSWAWTCSKARPGEFGGNCALIGDGWMEAMSRYSWEKEVRKRHGLQDAKVS
jgi:hypothetical protein